MEPPSGATRLGDLWIPQPILSIRRIQHDPPNFLMLDTRAPRDCLRGRYLLSILPCFSPTAEALGSSAIVKVSEQTGAAPKPIPPRFPSKGSQGSLKVPKRFPKGSLKSLKVPSRFPARFPSFPSKGCQGSQDYYVKVPK